MTYNTLTPKTMQLWKDNNIHKGYAYSEDLNLYYFDDFGSEDRMQEFMHLASIYDREDTEEYK